MLSPGPFIDQNDNLNIESHLKLKQIMEIAKKYDLKVILSMCNWWEGWPQSWKVGYIFTDPDTLKHQKEYFFQMANSLKDEEALFAYSLFEEPAVGWGDRSPEAKNEPINQKWNEWLGRVNGIEGRYKDEDEWILAWGRDIEREDDWHFYIYPPDNSFDPLNKKLYDYQLFRQDVATNWVKEIATVIREADQNHLIQSPGLLVFSTVLFPNPWGYDPSSYSGFNPQKFVDYVDYLDIHLYPWRYGTTSFTPSDLAYAQAISRYCYSGKPVISTDFGCDDFAAVALDFFEITNGSLSGWLNWAAYETDDTGWLHRYTFLFDANGQITHLGEFYKSFYTYLPQRAESTRTMNIDMLYALTDIDYCYRVSEYARELILTGENPDFVQDYPCRLVEGNVKPKEGTTDTEFVFEVRCIDNDYSHPESITVSVALADSQDIFKTLELTIEIDPSYNERYLNDVFYSSPIKIEYPAESFFFTFEVWYDREMDLLPYRRASSIMYSGGPIKAKDSQIPK